MGWKMSFAFKNNMSEETIQFSNSPMKDMGAPFGKQTGHPRCRLQHRWMLARRQAKCIGVGMANQVEVVAIQPLYWWQESVALLSGTSERHSGIGKVRNGGISGGTVPGEVTVPSRLWENRIVSALTQAVWSWRKLVGKVWLWKRSQGSIERFCDKVSFGLQESQNPSILGIFGLHSLHCGQIVN